MTTAETTATGQTEAMFPRKPRKGEVILPDSPEAARLMTVTGWVSIDGKFLGAGPSGEQAARYASSTHSKCEDCGKAVGKGWCFCSDCRSKRAFAIWHEAPKFVVGEDDFIFSDALDHYYADAEELFEEMSENVANHVFEDLEAAYRSSRLYVCKPQYGHELDGSFFEDERPEDDELPSEICDAIDAFNAAVKVCGPLSFTPDFSRAVDVEPLIAAALAKAEAAQ